MSDKEPSSTLASKNNTCWSIPRPAALPLIHPKKILGECEERLGGIIKPELLKSQIEVATGVYKSISGGREELTRLRGTVAEVANKYGLAPIAASTHPFPNGRSRTTQTRNAIIS